MLWLKCEKLNAPSTTLIAIRKDSKRDRNIQIERFPTLSYQFVRPIHGWTRESHFWLRSNDLIEPRVELCSFWAGIVNSLSCHVVIILYFLDEKKPPN